MLYNLDRFDKEEERSISGNITRENVVILMCYIISRTRMKRKSHPLYRHSNSLSLSIHSPIPPPMTISDWN